VRKLIVILLAVMLMAAAGVAQTAIDPLLGSHNVGGAGCDSCHTPHNALPGQGAYLWASAIPTGSYNTYLTSDGNGGIGALNAGQMIGALTNAMSGPLQNLPMAHTVLCLSCHDTAFNFGMAASIPTSTTIGSQFNIGTSGNLTGDHPVNVVYPAANAMYFQATITGSTVSFTDTAYLYGHPAKLYTDGTSMYVECSTCHNPHNQTATVVPVPGSTGNVNQGVCTTHFIRGQYRATNEVATNAAPTPNGCTETSTTYQVDNANFCMSCHAYPTAQFNGTANP